jgi:hypothetical protein
MTNFTIKELAESVTSQWVSTDTSTGVLMYTDENGIDYKVTELIERLEAVEKRLAILEDPTPEQLENHKMLKEAYTKYKFIEGLCAEEDDNNG